MSTRLGDGNCPVADGGYAYHMDPFLLAIQIPELVGADVNQGAQVTMISTREKEDMGIGPGKWWH